MPTISRFFGIRVWMNLDDHLPPHFHAEYGGQEAQIEIATGQLLRGDLPRRAQQMLAEWTALHHAELEANWQRSKNQQPVEKIEPLQ